MSFMFTKRYDRSNDSVSYELLLEQLHFKCQNDWLLGVESYV